MIHNKINIVLFIYKKTELTKKKLQNERNRGCLH